MVRLYFEDLGLFAKWFLDVVERHCGPPRVLEYIEVRQHTRWRDHEVDLLILCKEERGRKVKSIIVELKEVDVRTALRQALVRRQFADYVYDAFALHVADILNAMSSGGVREVAREALSEGVG